MITQWDIISSLNADESADLAYALVMDGTDHDVQVVASALKEYIRHAPTQALPPFIYRFELPSDLNEDAQEQIRILMRQAVEQANKDGFIIPGGPLGNPLFSQEATQILNLPTAEKKDLPPQSNQKTIDLSDIGEDAIPHIGTNSVSPDYPQTTDTEIHRKKWVSTETLDKFFTIPNTQPENQPAEQTKTKQPQESVSQAETVPTAEKMDTQPTSAPSITEKNSLPSGKETLLKQVENTSSNASDQPLEDIFLAETKYDIFVDIAKEAPQAKAAAALAQKPKDSGKITPATPAQPLPDVPPATPEAEKPIFNIFDQKIKEQTSLIDIDDINEITQRITEKDLAFAQHIKPTDQMPLAASAVADSSKSLKEPDEEEEVMDPFEQLLAGKANEPENPAPVPQEQPQEPLQELQSAPEPARDIEQEIDITQQPDVITPEQSAVPQENNLQKDTKAALKQENRVFPIPTASMENNMNQNQGEKKPVIHIKRKEQPPQAPAVPLPPKPAAPQAPIPAAPQKPAPVQPQAPAMPPAHPGNTMLRRRRFSKTFLEKTTTIDHSIELPLSELKKHNWPLEVPLVPTYTLENMTISVNRFAHATAISVIENPGKLYNPLVLHGTSGTGKTHFLHAIGYALSKKYGQENIFITNGVRLSRGIQRYIMEGNINKFEEFVSSVKALLIDDIHLISINEQNRAHLSKLLNDFIAQQKQIVITSKYPPENLAKLEELLNFKLDSGWISDLKPAHGPARMRIIQNMLTSNGINITNEDINRFFGHPNMSLGTVVRSIRRVRVLEKLIFPNIEADKRSPLTIFDQLLATKGEDQSSMIAQKSIDDIQSASVKGNGEWGRIGFFYPQNNSNMMNWMLFALQQRAKELGIPGGPELAVRSSYSTENIISSAFKIANLCDNKKLKSAIILGPHMNVCEPSVRENFYDILTHMLEVMLIRCGVINFEEVTAPSTYVKILAELLR